MSHSDVTPDRAASLRAARAAATRVGADLRVALDAYDEARSVAGAARALSLDQQGTVFELSGIVGRLAARS